MMRIKPRDPDFYLCGCPKVSGERQCRPCHNAQTTARRRGEPAKRVRAVVETHFTCNHPRIPVNMIGGGKGFPKGRCRYCRTGVLTFDPTTGKPLPYAKIPAESPRGTPMSDTKVREVQRLLADHVPKSEITRRTGVSRSSVFRVARGEVVPSGVPDQPARFRFELVSVQPLPSPAESTAGRSYALFPLKQSRAG